MTPPKRNASALVMVRTQVLVLAGTLVMVAIRQKRHALSLAILDQVLRLAPTLVMGSALEGVQSAQRV